MLRIYLFDVLQYVHINQWKKPLISQGSNAAGLTVVATWETSLWMRFVKLSLCAAVVYIFCCWARPY